MSDRQRENDFKTIWKGFKIDLPSTSDGSILQLFESNLTDLFHEDNTILRTLMNETKWPECDNTIQSLESSVETLTIKNSDLRSTFFLAGEATWIKGMNVKIISPDIISVFSDLDTAILNSCSTDCEILEQHVKEFLLKIQELVNEIKAKQDRIGKTLTPKCIIKIYLHASRYAAKKFQNHNELLKIFASQIKQENSDKRQIQNEFESLWKGFEKDLSIKTESKGSIVQLFESNLNEILHKDHTVLHSLMLETNWPKCDSTIQSLESSVNNLKIEEIDLSSTFSYEGGKVWIKGKRVKRILPDIISVFSDLDTAIQYICRTDVEVLEQHVKQFLRQIEEWVNKIKAEKDRIGMTLTSKFIIKIYIHASRYAAKKYQIHNEMYEQKYGITDHLRRYKEQAKVRLNAMIADRSAEDIATDLFAFVIEEFVTDTIKDRMSTEVYDQLLQEIPRPKFNLMVEIVTDLARTGKFEDWVKYIISPESYSRGWVGMKCKNHLFGNNGAYSKSAKAKACVIFIEIKDSICKSLEQETKLRKTDAWIQSFIKGMIQYPISSDRFNNVKFGFEEITARNVENFSGLLINKIEKSQLRIELAITHTTDENVVWNNDNPYKTTFDRVWGCTEMCPFCGETCARDKAHDGIPHYCIQHRPQGCRGIRHSFSQEILVSCCNYYVQSDWKHTCGVFTFKCNKKGSESCPLKMHKYRDFRKFAPKWDIAPNPNMDDTSKIWMWFMGNFRKDLENHFECVVDNIPERWDTIPKADAIQSYGELMADN